MSISLSFIRLFFLLLCVLLTTSYATHNLAGGVTVINLFIGAFGGLLFTSLLIAIENTFKQLNLRSFNIAIIGLLIGYLMGQAVILILDAVLDVSNLESTASNTALMHTLVYLVSVYLAMVMTARASEELYISIPFVKFKPVSHKKKDILLEISALTDVRMIDLASTGLLNHHLILPRFLLKELYVMSESPDEAVRNKARRSLDVVRA